MSSHTREFILIVLVPVVVLVVLVVGIHWLVTTINTIIERFPQ